MSTDGARPDTPDTPRPAHSAQRRPGTPSCGEYPASSILRLPSATSSRLPTCLKRRGRPVSHGLWAVGHRQHLHLNEPLHTVRSNSSRSCRPVSGGTPRMMTSVACGELRRWRARLRVWSGTGMGTPNRCGAPAPRGRREVHLTQLRGAQQDMSRSSGPSALKRPLLIGRRWRKPSRLHCRLPHCAAVRLPLPD